MQYQPLLERDVQSTILVGWHLWPTKNPQFLAKLLEHYDATIYRALGQISGHSLKHVSAGIAVFLIIQAIPLRATGTAESRAR